MVNKSKRLKPKTTLKHRVLKIVFFLIPILLMYWIFAVFIPSQVSYADIWATISALSLAQNILLLLCGLLVIAVYGWTSATVLPGLSLPKGIQSAASGQLTSVVLPVPADLIIRFSMYKSYGFSVDKSTVAVGVAGISRYFTVVAIPIMGLAALIISGQGTTTYVAWFIVGMLVFVIAVWVMKLILESTKTAKKVGLIIQKISNAFLKIIRKSPNNSIEAKIVDFGAKTRTVAVDHFKSIAVSNVAWGLASYLVLLLASRFCGIDSSAMSNAYILFITGCMLFLNAFPITPGGIGVTETILLTFIPFPSPEVQAAFASALFVYRIYTWLLPLPVGGIAYYTWSRHNKLIPKPVSE